MDVNISILKDNKRQIENLIRKIKANKEKYQTAELSEKRRLKDTFNFDFRSIKEIMNTMDMEIASLKSEEAELEYRDILSKFKLEVKDLMEDIKRMEQIDQQSNNRNANLEEIELREKPVEELKIQEAFDRGDKILDEGDKAIARMNKKIYETKDVSSAIKQNLIKQRDQLINTQKNLKEMDYSLDRATKTLKNMFKTYATDKLILGILVIIAIAIVAIIIVAAVGGDSSGNFNVPHDIFSSSTSSKNSTTSSTRILR